MRFSEAVLSVENTVADNSGQIEQEREVDFQYKYRYLKRNIKTRELAYEREPHRVF